MAIVVIVAPPAFEWNVAIPEVYSIEFILGRALGYILT